VRARLPADGPSIGMGEDRRRRRGDSPPASPGRHGRGRARDQALRRLHLGPDISVRPRGQATLLRRHHLPPRTCGREPRQHGHRRHRAFEGRARRASGLWVRHRHHHGKRAEKMNDMILTDSDSAMDARAAEIRDEHLLARRVRVDRMFCGLLLVEWVAGIIGALVVSPYAWEGKVHTVHLHVWVATLGGAGIIILPILLAIFRPGTKLTRHVIAASQMLVSALLIHLTGGRIETHFHVFGSLAFLAFYRDWRAPFIGPLAVAAGPILPGPVWAGAGLRTPVRAGRRAAAAPGG